jgi:selenocysteine lyase/cysteine desulfurase
MPEKARSALEAELYRHLEERLDALELDLDADPEAVARFLRDKGIKVRREKACHCPLAKYLAEDLPPSLVVHCGRMED